MLQMAEPRRPRSPWRNPDSGPASASRPQPTVRGCVPSVAACPVRQAVFPCSLSGNADKVCSCSAFYIGAGDIVAIERSTKEGADWSFCGAPRTTSHFNGVFGNGCWRPLQRFLVMQHSGIQRVIDGAWASDHGTSTRPTSSMVDWWPVAAATLFDDFLESASRRSHELRGLVISGAFPPRHRTCREVLKT